MNYGLPDLYGSNLVLGDGPIPCSYMIIGEAPGEEEDRYGKPFCGRAGNILTKLIRQNSAIKRSEIYITNAVKQRPPQNRKPTIQEILKHRDYLLAEIKTISPEIIVTLGKSALESLLGKEIQTLSRYVGEPIETFQYILYPTYHPASLFHSSIYLKDIQWALSHIKQGARV